MKTIKVHIFFSTVFCAMLMAGCQQDDLDAMKIPPSRPAPGGFIPNPEPTIIPTSDVIREVFPHAIGWTIRWNDPEANDWQLNAGFLNVDEGSLYSFNSLNNGAGEVLANVDVNLLGGGLSRQIIAPNQYPGLGQEENRRSTKFLPFDMSAEELMSVANGINPGLWFEEAFETHPNLPKSIQPHDYENPVI